MNTAMMPHSSGLLELAVFFFFFFFFSALLRALHSQASRLSFVVLIFLTSILAAARLDLEAFWSQALGVKDHRLGCLLAAALATTSVSGLA